MLRICCVCLSLLLLVTDVRCDPDYSFISEARGWLKLHTTPKTWEEAFLKCHDEGAVLASPLDKMLANVLRRLVAQSGVNSNFFLGTHNLFSKDHYISVEGVALSDMEVTLASSSVSTEDCLSMSADGRAYHSSCKNPLPFICYKKPENQTMNECGTFDDEYRFNQNTGSCYKVHTSYKSWDRAFDKCASEGAYLVIINDAEEANVLHAMFPDHYAGVEQFHIGLVAWGEQRTWMTIHGQKIEDVFNVWDVNQPDNVGRAYRATFLKGPAKMDDVNNDVCFAMFVCEKSPMGIVDSEI